MKTRSTKKSLKNVGKNKRNIIYPFYHQLVILICHLPSIILAVLFLCNMSPNSEFYFISAIAFTLGAAQVFAIFQMKHFSYVNKLDPCLIFSYYLSFYTKNTKSERERRMIEKRYSNIDDQWNLRPIPISEIEYVETVKLTQDEQCTKVHYKHLFNKYLKFTLKNSDPQYGNVKYVYVGNYSKRQIKKIVHLASLASSWH